MKGRKLSVLIFIGFFIVALLIFSSCSKKSESIILQREWTANAEFAGDVWGSKIASDNGYSIEVREGSEAIDPIKEVRSGAVHFGVASADRILRENEAGSELVIVATACYKSPVVFLTQPSIKIKSLKDLYGLIVGIQSGTNTELVFKSMIQSQNLDLSKIKVVESGWGTSSFETKAIDVLAAFDYDEPVQLTMSNIKFNVINPSDWDYPFIGTVYFTRKSIVNNNPDLVNRFMQFLVDGWKHAIKDPEQAIDILSSHFSSITRSKELESLKQGIPYFRGENGHLLYASPESWNKMASRLINLGQIKGFVFAKNVNYRFLEAALEKR